MRMRDASNVRIRPRKPSPSSPSRFSTGTRTLSRKISALTIARWPIFDIGLPSVRPGVSRSTTNAVMPRDRSAGSTVVKMTVHRAYGALEIHAFWPFRT